MKKLFGEFLVEKAIVSEVDLLDALMQQMAALPTVVELVYRAKLIPNADILRVLAHQSKNNMEFKKACEDLGLWSAETEQNVAREINKIKIPVGQLLVASGKVTFQKITMALDEYLAEVEEKEGASPAAVKVPVIAPPVEAQVIQVVAEAAPAEASAPTHTVALEGYTEFLNDSRKTALKGLLAALTVEGTNLLDTLQLFHQGIHEIKGMARFIRATHSECLLDEVETVITVVQLQGGASKDQLVQFAEKCGKSVDLLWDVKEGMCTAGSEDAYWSKVEGTFNTLLAELKNVSTYILTGSIDQVKEAA